MYIANLVTLIFQFPPLRNTGFEIRITLFQRSVELRRFYIHTVDRQAWAVLLSGMILSPASSDAQPKHNTFSALLSRIIMYVHRSMQYLGWFLD